MEAKPLLVRPDFAAFNPKTLQPQLFTDVYRYITRSTGFEAGSRFKVLPLEVLPPPTTEQPQREGFFGRTINRVSSWVVDRLSGEDPNPVPVPTREDEDKERDRRVGVVWGLWAGWMCAEGADGETLSRELALTSEQAHSERALRMRPFATLMSRGPGAGPALDANLPADVFVRPAIPPIGLLRAIFSPPGAVTALIYQAILHVPWDQLSLNDADRSVGQGGLGDVAPALDGLLACNEFRHLLDRLVQTPRDGEAAGQSIDALWTYQAASASAHEAFCGAEGGKGGWVNWRLQNRIFSRSTPLIAPFRCEDVLHTALWANLTAKDFHDVIAAVKSIGGDAIILAAAGAMAGACLGKAGIPEEIFARMPDWDLVERLASIHVDDCGRKRLSDGISQMACYTRSLP
jgi:hypothetical protein